MTKIQYPEAIANESECVVFKGYKSGLILIIPEKGPFTKHLQELKERLEQSRDFFRGAQIRLKTGNRILQESERSSLIQLVTESGLFPRFLEEFEAPAVGICDHSSSLNENKYFIPTITVKKTVRSGQRVIFEGNLVIIGDVNPGAEVIASGDIMVLGALRGTAHAGAKGDESAQIIAFQLKPMQIRIAGVFTRAPEQEIESKYLGPEVAKIKNGLIMVERF